MDVREDVGKPAIAAMAANKADDTEETELAELPEVTPLAVVSVELNEPGTADAWASRANCGAHHSGHTDCINPLAK